MGKLLLVAVFLVGLAQTTEDFDTEIADLRGIEHMTESNYRDITGKGDALIYFHHDKCTDCRKISPFLGNISSALKSKRSGLTVAEVDVDSQPALAGLFKVESFPAWVLVFADKSRKEMLFNGRPAFNTLFTWVVRNVGDKFETLKNIQELEIAKNSSAMLLFVQGNFDRKIIQTIGDYFYPKYENLTLAVSESELVEGSPVRLFKSFDFPEVSYTGELTVESLEKFISQESQYVVMPHESNDFSEKMFTRIGTANLILFTNDRNCEEYTQFIKAAHIWKDQKGSKINNWAHIKIGTGKFTNLYSYLSHHEIAGPELWIVIKQEDGVIKYKWHEKIDVHGIQAFIDKYENGHLKQTIKSQPIPEEQPIEGVTFVVGNTFEEEVMNSAQHVFLLIIAVNCKYSHAMVPHYDEIAKLLLPLKDKIKFTVMDGLNNEVTDLYIGGFPSLLLFKAGSKDEEPLEFGDTRHRSAILRFIIDSLPDIDFSSVLSKEDLKAAQDNDEDEEEPIDMSQWIDDNDL